MPKKTILDESDTVQPESPCSFSFLDFFAGSGLVSEGLEPFFKTIWANDISESKAAVFLKNHRKEVFHLGPIQDVRVEDVPAATLSWASFPCQDLSLAGKLSGINGKRSGFVWTWLQLMDGMRLRPPIVVAENVSGLTSANAGTEYRFLHNALTSRGYRVGPLLLDAARWVPQSRKRVFVVGVLQQMALDGLTDNRPNWLHPSTVVRAVNGVSEAIWWKLPEPPSRTVGLSDLIQYDAPFDSDEKVCYTLSLIPPEHMVKLNEALHKGLSVFPGYKRIRKGRQVLEIRADNAAGCLRTANGGSSRQFLVISADGRLRTRLLTVREAARLMGVPDSYQIPGNYNDGYNAMGDAVAIPVARHLARYLLWPLARRLHAGH